MLDKLNKPKKIIELDQDLINKIAAGEVIERPSSVVKELVENSIDAGATSIVVEVNEGGKSLIKITDNGSGIPKEDMAIAVKRHTTSKIKEVVDLFNINTLGFRGEALASIGSVSYTKIISKPWDEETGCSIEVEGGVIRQQKEAASPKGTIVEVNNLFFNVPARKKHLKSMQAEFRYILDILTRYCLINPLIHFKLIHNDVLILNSPSTTDTLANVASIYGNNIAKKLLPVNFSFFDIDVMGFVSKPELTRADRNYQSIYVNRRYIKNQMIQRAVYGGYGSLLFHGRHPVFILDVRIDPKKTDVNVHPTKSEIRIEKEDIVYQTIKNAVMSVFKDESLIPEIRNIKSRAADTQLFIGDAQDLTRQTLLDDSQYAKSPNFSQGKIKDLDAKEEKRKISKLTLRLIGRIHSTYVIAEDDESMLLIDQHAAHERVMFERFMKQYYEQDIKAQQLINPIILELNANDALAVQENLDVFNKLGVRIEEFGKSTYIVRSLPSILARQQDRLIIQDIIDEMNSDEITKISRIKEEQIAIAACRAAVKAHDVLEMPQIYKILDDLFKCENQSTCPHGRPIMIRFPLSEIEKKFLRK